MQGSHHLATACNDIITQLFAKFSLVIGLICLFDFGQVGRHFRQTFLSRSYLSFFSIMNNEIMMKKLGDTSENPDLVITIF